ncbi:MAG: hypothetical protein HY302_09845 [Opitutae bacterium]|nr:hypothetical protein [Opitutae bacterium]
MPIPPKLKILLVREAHLKFGRDAIAPLLGEKEAEYQALEKARPGLFASKEKKLAHEQQLAEAMETLRLLRNGIAQLDRVEPHLKRMVEEEAESHLRATSPAYLTALAARQHREDWIKCLERFGEKVYGLKQALGNVRNMACSGYQREAQSYSQATVQAFMLAISAGKKVEEEVKFANRISDVQEKTLLESGFKTVALPKLKEIAFSQWVALISNMPLAEAQQQFDQIIGEARKLYEEGLPQMREQAEAAHHSQGEVIMGFARQRLEEMRLAIVPEINLEETEESVASSERMLNEMSRASVLGRLPTI